MAIRYYLIDYQYIVFCQNIRDLNYNIKKVSLNIKTLYRFI